MPFDFDSPLDRRNSDSIKWNYYGADVLPMWVADMCFRSAEPIVQALRERVEHGVYGYAQPPKSLHETVVRWCERQYGWTITPDDVIFLPGLVSGLNLVCRAYGHMGDSTITLSPVYPPMFSSATEQGMTCIHVPLTQSLVNGALRFDIDFAAFEKAITPRTTLLMLCHPHNPTGREFTREELTQLGEICARKNVLICSDEIHGDLVLDGRKHLPMAAVSPEIADRTITLMAPSKTFNIPGLGCSFAIVTNPQLRQRLNGARSGIVPWVNLMGLAATEAAFSNCDSWLGELRTYLAGNRDFTAAYIAEHMPSIKTTVPEATYLAFLDCAGTQIVGDPYKHFLERAKVATNAGSGFGKGGDNFVRLNFGCPRAQLLEALEKMAESLPV
jgi:cysteine-S-conjugate beta-lyase